MTKSIKYVTSLSALFLLSSFSLQSQAATLAYYGKITAGAKSVNINVIQSGQTTQSVSLPPGATRNFNIYSSTTVTVKYLVSGAKTWTTCPSFTSPATASTNIYNASPTCTSISTNWPRN